MLNEIPEFDLYYVAYLKDVPGKQPLAISEQCARRSCLRRHIRPGRAKADFELREISKEEYERMKSIF